MTTTQETHPSHVRPAAMTITDAAVDHARSLLSGVDDNIIGLRVGLRSGGCSGYKYIIDYASDVKKHEEVVEKDGVTVIVDPTAVMFLLGSEMDYQEGQFESGFTFKNPNETGRCGCGESISFQ
jgi:iron-sulfur cluster assembly accessory protein